MMVIDYNLKKDELLEHHYNIIITKINECFKENKRFVLKDLIPDEKYNAYYINKTKGILETLLALDYIKIVSLYHNYKNYVFICSKKIP